MTSMSEQQLDLSDFKEIVARAGAEWCGIQETVPPGLPLLMFNSKTSKSTYAVSFNPAKYNAAELEAKVCARIQEKDKQFEEKKMNLKEKLHHIYEIIDHIDKTGQNKAQNYDYLKSVEVTRAVRKAFIELKVYAEINFDFCGGPYTIARAKDPAAPFTAVNVKCSAVFHDLESTEIKTASGLGTGCDTNDKAAYKAQTGALKYALKNAFLIPDEADPEADESVDDPNSGRSTPIPAGDEMPDFQDAARGKPAPNRPPKAEVPAARPTPAPSGTAKPPKAEVPAVLGAGYGLGGGEIYKNEYGDMVRGGLWGYAKSVCQVDESDGSALPTEAQLNDYRKKFQKLGDDLSTEGKLKASQKLPLNVKLKVFLLSVTKADDARNITVAQWDDFFARVETAKNAEGVGLVGVATLVNRANGVEEKKKK